ncbi:MAG: DUF1223 domain-containing protein [Hyphomicrobiaceae bacterium]|nr:DUF1223 domain-containing protein [Hyphomicrobiaceae bacterium]MCC0023772.1 DUF1223 domain-containing protein [Hyphomicrobiaceae bacterium]
MKSLTSLSFVLAAFALTMPVQAGETVAHPKAVVELFTSQGCSSCPPADALLTEIDKRDDVIALAYHVDYWDYIGWPDTFASPRFSALQRAYARSWNKNRVYTPQMVINGVSDVVGSRQSAVNQAISTAQLPVEMDLTQSGHSITISIPPDPGLKPSILWMVTYKDRADVDIGRGENAGRTIAYSQIVMDRRSLGMWEPDEGLHMTIPTTDMMGADAEGFAFLLQQDADGLPGPIIAASAISL